MHVQLNFMLLHACSGELHLVGYMLCSQTTCCFHVQVKSLERSVYKVRGWLKTRGEDMIVTQCDIGTSVESVQAVLEHHDKCESKARVCDFVCSLSFCTSEIRTPL